MTLYIHCERTLNTSIKIMNLTIIQNNNVTKISPKIIQDGQIIEKKNLNAIEDKNNEFEWKINSRLKKEGRKRKMTRWDEMKWRWNEDSKR